jgi:hypothetical protein
MWVPPDCGGQNNNIVYFADPNLAKCILDMLPGKPAQITITQAQQILEVSCPNKSITDLTGIEQFTGLVKLDLTANQITQFPPTASFAYLQTLKIGDTQISQLDVGNLLSATAPVRLVASNNHMTSFSGTASVNFIMLDLSNNQLTSVDLADQNYLVYVDLSGNPQMTNVLDPNNQNLSKLSQLQYLDLSHDSLQTIGPVTAMAQPTTPNPQPALQSLFLACNPDFQCSSLCLDAYAPASALQVSSCAQENPQTQAWTMFQNPSCPTQPMKPAAKPTAMTPPPCPSIAERPK